MQKRGFEADVSRVVKDDPRYCEDAYLFLREALDFTVRELENITPLEDLEVGPGRPEDGRHVSGRELLDGFREYCLQEFGPMAITVLHEWGLHESIDIGHMVFNLILRSGASSTSLRKRRLPSSLA